MNAYTVADEGGTPASEHTTETLGYANLRESLHVALVELRVHLSSALDQVQGRNGRMSQTL